jgi:hypothetical protein
MLARGRIIGWALIGAVSLLPVAGAVALRVEAPAQAQQVTRSEAEQAQYVQGARDERQKLNQYRAINGTSGLAGPVPDARHTKATPTWKALTRSLRPKRKEKLSSAPRKGPEIYLTVIPYRRNVATPCTRN